MYHELFDEAMAAYNAKKKKTRDKIPDYYEHIRQSKQEKLFHEAIFQIGNLTDCGCGSPGGERAAAALKEFAESFQERNPHLRVFNMVPVSYTHLYGAAHGRGHAPPPCGLRAGGNGAEPGPLNTGINETGVKAAGI